MNRKRNESTNRSLWIAFLAIVFLAACSGNPSLRKIEKESDNPKLAAAVLHRTDSILARGGLSDEEEGRMLLAKAKAQFFLNYMTQSFPPRLDSVYHGRRAETGAARQPEAGRELLLAGDDQQPLLRKARGRHGGTGERPPHPPR